MMTAEIMQLIMDNTNPVADIVTGLLFLQLLVTTFSEVTTLYQSIKSQSRQLKVMVCLVPGMFIAACGIFMPLLFGAFVGGGTNAAAMETIVKMAVSSQFLGELLVVIVAFAVLMVPYCLVFRPRWVGALITFGVEITIALSWLVAAGGLLIEGFPLKLADTDLFPYLIYGFYSLIYKLLLTLVCIIVGIVFKDTIPRNTAAKEYFVEGGNYEAATIQFLNYRQKSIGGVSFIALCFLFGILFYLILNDMGLPIQLSSLQQLPGEAIFFLLLPILLMPMSLLCLLFAFAPRLSPAFRKLEKQDAFQLFYEEVASKYKHLPVTGTIETKHFSLRQIFLIYWVEIRST